MATKRSGKWYRNNEAKLMKMLGLEPTPNSGSGWIVKEDGQNENVICQLKSTDAYSIKVVLNDLQKLEYNAIVAHKIPVFAIQFIQNDDIYLLVKPSNLSDLAHYIDTGENNSKAELPIDVGESELEETETCPVKTIRSSSSARESFRKEYQNKFRKETRSAK